MGAHTTRVTDASSLGEAWCDCYHPQPLCGMSLGMHPPLLMAPGRSPPLPGASEVQLHSAS